MPLFQYINILPEIPEELRMVDLKELQTQENIFRNPKYLFYKLYDIKNKKLIEFLNSIFNFPFWAGYQLVRNGLHIHKDYSRSECINYQFDPGGDLNSLNIYDEDKQTILHKEHILPNKWHYINVGKYHNVTGLSRPRIGISVMRIDNKKIDIL
jgi:hypothetical protein